MLWEDLFRNVFSSPSSPCTKEQDPAAFLCTSPAAGGGNLINFNAATNKEDADRYYIETSGD